MRLRALLVSVAAASALSGCVTMQSIVDKTTQPDPATGYVGGTFVTTGGAFKYGFGIRDAVGKQWFLPFADLANNGTRYLDGTMTGFVALPPGDYRVGSWVKSNMDTSGKAVPATDAVGRPFHLEAGHVLYLGSFDASTTSSISGNMIITHFSIRPKATRADEVWAVVTRTYPGFGNAPIECLLCTAPPADSTHFAQLALADAADFSHEHDVVVHAFRPDRQYSTAGLTAWEKVDGAKDRDVVDASWKVPAKPVRTDTFGAVFVVNDLNFKDGKVYFVVRDPERAQAPLERSFLLGEAREVWVNDGDPKVYRSEKEAMAARHE